MVKWGKLFGSKANSKPAVQPTKGSQEAVGAAKEKLDEAEDLLMMKRDMLERQISQQLEKAQQLNQQNNKTGALAALRKKKMLEAQLEQIDNSVLRIAEQQLVLESSQTTILTLSTLQQASQASDLVSGQLRVEQVDRLRDDLDDQHDQMRQISDLLGQPVGAAADLDVDDLEAELEDLEQQLVEEELIGAAPTPRRIEVLPSVPANKAALKTAEELELEQLEKQMLAA